MSIFGVAKRGFGMLKKGKKGSDAKSKFLERRRVLGGASAAMDKTNTIKKAKRVIKEGKEAIKKRMMSPHPLTPISKGKKWIGRINPDGTHVKPKKAVGGIVSKLKKLNKLKGVHGGKGMVALGAGSAGSALWARHEIKKFEKKVKEAGGKPNDLDEMKKSFVKWASEKKKKLEKKKKKEK